MNAQVAHCIDDSERKFRTGRKRVFARSCFVGIAMVAGATAAAASCDNRPGTPTNVTAQVLSSNSINFSWRNTTGHWLAEPKMFFDMYLQHGGKSIGRDLTGTGPYSVSFGSTSSYVFNGLAPNTNYCFALRARTEGGTQGCISEVTSNWACATTVAVGASVPNRPQGPPPPPPFVISATGGPNNTVTITGSGFLHNAPVGVRVADQARNYAFVLITSIGGQRITSDGNGSIKLTFQGLCTQQGATVSFSAEDGRKIPSGADTLWSNTASIRCT